MIAIREILNAGNSWSFGLHRVLDFVDNFFGANQVGELGKDNALTAGSDVFDMRGRARSKYRARSRKLAHSVESDYLATFG